MSWRQQTDDADRQTDRQTDIWRCLSVQYFWGCCVAATIDGAGDGEEGGVGAQ